MISEPTGSDKRYSSNTVMTQPLLHQLVYLTPMSRVHLQKLLVSQQVGKLSAFSGTRWFITGFTTAHRWHVSEAILIQSPPPHPMPLRSILISISHLPLGLLTDSFLRVSHENHAHTSIFSHACHMSRPSHPHINHPNKIWQWVDDATHCAVFLHPPAISSLLSQVIFPSTPFSIPQPSVPLMSEAFNPSSQWFSPLRLVNHRHQTTDRTEVQSYCDDKNHASIRQECHHIRVPVNVTWHCVPIQTVPFFH